MEAETAEETQTLLETPQQAEGGEKKYLDFSSSLILQRARESGKCGFQ